MCPSKPMRPAYCRAILAWCCGLNRSVPVSIINASIRTLRNNSMTRAFRTSSVVTARFITSVFIRRVGTFNAAQRLSRPITGYPLAHRRPQARNNCLAGTRPISTTTTSRSGVTRLSRRRGTRCLTCKAIL